WRKSCRAGRVSGAGSSWAAVTSRYTSSASATASKAEPRFADDAGTRTTQSAREPPDCGPRRTASAWHETVSNAHYRHGVRRHCARTGCSAPATATFTFDTRDLTVWLATPADAATPAR